MLTAMTTAILQFGTSRFLQAHADLFIAEALSQGNAPGPVTVVETTGNPQSRARIAALAAEDGYPVIIRGLADGQVIDERRQIRPIVAGLSAGRDWPAVIAAGCAAAIILSNTGDQGFALDPADGPAALVAGATAPISFPAKLLVILYHRWQQVPERPLSLFPCELISRNGDTLRDLIISLAEQWQIAAAFIGYLRHHCRWANALVDRIVSEPIEPAGAVAEPYALWAIEEQEGLVLPARHPAIVLTDDLGRYERLKLYLLNLGHTMLAESWTVAGGPADLTVRQAMATPALRDPLESTWAEEVLPVFEALGEGPAARDYLATVRDRFLNPFLNHKLADIAKGHDEKKQRRLAPVIRLAEHYSLPLAQARLRAAVGRR